MFYDIFYNFIANNLLGQSAMETVPGQLFAQYGGYVMIALSMVLLYKVVKGLFYAFKI